MLSVACKFSESKELCFGTLEFCGTAGVEDENFCFLGFHPFKFSRLFIKRKRELFMSDNIPDLSMPMEVQTPDDCDLQSLLDKGKIREFCSAVEDRLDNSECADEIAAGGVEHTLCLIFRESLRQKHIEKMLDLLTGAGGAHLFPEMIVSLDVMHSPFFDGVFRSREIVKPLINKDGALVLPKNSRSVLRAYGYESRSCFRNPKSDKGKYRVEILEALLGQIDQRFPFWWRGKGATIHKTKATWIQWKKEKIFYNGRSEERIFEALVFFFMKVSKITNIEEQDEDLRKTLFVNAKGKTKPSLWDPHPQAIASIMNWRLNLDMLSDNEPTVFYRPDAARKRIDKVLRDQITNKT